MIDFYFSNNTSQKKTFAIRGTSMEGDAWLQPLENIILTAHETKIIPLTIGAQRDGKIKVNVIYHDEVTEKTFPFKKGLAHSYGDMFYDNFRNGMKKWQTL